MIENKALDSIIEEMSAKVDELIPGGAWEFGGNRKGEDNSFTLTGEGNLHLQLLTLFWLEQAPIIPGWTFYAARPPDVLLSRELRLEGALFDPTTFWIVPSVDLESEKIDLAVWHPEFQQFDDKMRWTVLFLFLDQVLGEYGTQRWIGQITFRPERLGDAIGINELNDFVAKVQAEHDWKMLLPGEASTLYTLMHHDSFPRGDIITGVTQNRVLLDDYLEANGDLKDPLTGTGADYVYVAFDAAILPKGEQAEARGKIEDALDAALRTDRSGRLIGGAYGTSQAYVDLLLFDGQNSVEIVRKTVAELALQGGATINYFAREKRGQKIAV